MARPVTATLQCRLCGDEAFFTHEATLMGKYVIEYFACPRCHYLQTEHPFWLEEAYGESINVSDTGIVARNVRLAEFSACLFWGMSDVEGRYLDAAGGTGLYVRMMRDIGFDFYWADKFARNQFARGFEAEDKHRPYVAATCFEAFEHFSDPRAELDKLFEMTDVLLLSTEIYGETVPGPTSWPYYGLSHGQHIGFLNRQTLQWISEAYGCYVWTDGRGVHLLSRRPFAKWKLAALRLGRKLGLAQVVKRRMNSRTLADWERLCARD